jgi:hypothetical protein
MLAQCHAIDAKNIPSIGQVSTTWQELDEVVKNSVRLAQAQAARPPPPAWASQSQVEHDADVVRSWRVRTMTNRRILQGDRDDDSAVMQLLLGPTAWCDDPLSTNVGDGSSCAYDCQMLQDHYFPGEESRCFLYDTSTRGWPRTLLARKQTLSDSNSTIIVPNDENWIIQGTLGSNGLPVKLDARVSSGSAVDFSEASIVVRRVRFSGQIAPEDLDRVARDYGWIDDPFGGPTTLGGAFSYDGGGLQPDVRTPQLVFEHVVFDRNRAVVGSAVWIAGRHGTMSGLKLVMDGCLFFRNVAGFHSAILALNSCPSTVIVNNTDFIYNDAFALPHLWVGDMDTKIGVVGQRHTWTLANSHFEGPVGTYSNPGPLFGTHLAYTPDGANYDTLMERVTVFDVHGHLATGSGYLSAGARSLNCKIRESRVANATALDSNLDARTKDHSVCLAFLGCTNVEVSHLTLEDSGAFQDESRGEGVLVFSDELTIRPEYYSTNEYHVLDSVFARNQAARGAAIGWFSSKARLVVQRCLFEVGHDRDMIHRCAQSVHALVLYDRVPRCRFLLWHI